MYNKEPLIILFFQPANLSREKIYCSYEKYRHKTDFNNAESAAGQNYLIHTKAGQDILVTNDKTNTRHIFSSEGTKTYSFK